MEKASLWTETALTTLRADTFCTVIAPDWGPSRPEKGFLAARAMVCTPSVIDGRGELHWASVVTQVHVASSSACYHDRRPEARAL